MTHRLYYTDSFLYEFDAEVEAVVAEAPGVRAAVILNQTAFYPTSGGQVFDTGWLAMAKAGLSPSRVRVAEVLERDDGTIAHFLENLPPIEKGSRVHGSIDVERRRDHMQQHSGQHVLSAAFVRLFNMPTVSFHMGEDACSIDLDTESLTAEQVRAAEDLANDVVLQDREVRIRFVSLAEAQRLGLRKIPPAQRDELRLIEMDDFDLTACGGTHVRRTGEIGSILLRKQEKVKQGWRIEFVCGKRAVATARRDYTALAEAAALFSSHIWEVPQQIRKTQEDSRAARKSGERLLEELADLQAARLLSEAAESNGRRVVARSFKERDLGFIKLLAQRISRQSSAAVALLGTTAGQPAVVFAQSAGLPFDMNALMKEALSKLGGRGGGSKDMAQGGPATADGLDAMLAELARRLSA